MIALAPLALSWIAGAALLGLDGRRRPVAWLAFATLAVVAGLDLALLVRLAGGGAPLEVVTGGWPAGVGIRLRVDAVALLFSALCAGVLAAVAAHEARAAVQSRLFPALVVLLCAGLHGAFVTGDLFNFYVFFELAVVSSFALSAYGYGKAEVRAALIYVAVNLVGSVTFLAGVAGVYHVLGTLDLAQIAERAAAEGAGSLLLPASLLFVGLSVKLGLFPYHGWLPVLYSHARPAVVAALAGALANLGAYGLLRLGFGALRGARDEAAPFLVAIGLAASVYGAVVALRRRRPAEVAAYLAIVHAGYLVVAVGIGGVHGVVALLLTAVSGSLDKPLLFLSADARGPARRFAATVGVASVAGLPPTAGFLSKVALFRAALEAEHAAATLAGLLLSATLVLAAAAAFLARREAGEREPERSVAASPLALAAVTVALGVVVHPLVALVGSLGARWLGEAA